LIRYLYPTDSELRQLANIPKDKSKPKKNVKTQANGRTTSDTFLIPRSLDIRLETAKVTNLDIIHLRYYTEYQWLVDFSIYAAIVYVVTEGYQIWFPLKDEVNLSMIWCFLVILFAIGPASKIVYFREHKLVQVLLNLAFALPFILVVLWIKPVSRDYLTVRIFSGRTEPLLTEHAFESIRVIAIVVTMCLKLILMPWYLQAYLNMAYHRLEDQKKKLDPPNPDECPLNASNTNPDIELFKGADDTETITKTAAEFHLTLENLKMIFTTSIYKGLFGFSTWWCCFVYFATTSVGLVYQSYFSSV
ncbi:hypothetical protein NQ314_009998, partial [Rhamnusium bicolor]